MLIEVSVSNKDLGLVSFLFPKYPIFDYIPPFFRNEGLIYVSDKPTTPKPYNVVHVKRLSKYPLDTRKGFTEFLHDFRSIDLPDQFKTLDDTAFWVQAKIFATLKIHSIEESNSQSVFNLFKALFSSFDEKYTLYRQMNVPHTQVFSSLCTMMQKTKDTDNQTLSPFYRKVLLANKPYLPLFKQKALQYALSERTEWDFLAFLLSLNKR